MCAAGRTVKIPEELTAPLGFFITVPIIIRLSVLFISLTGTYLSSP